MGRDSALLYIFVNSVHTLFYSRVVFHGVLLRLKSAIAWRDGSKSLVDSDEG